MDAELFLYKLRSIYTLFQKSLLWKAALSNEWDCYRACSTLI